MNLLIPDWQQPRPSTDEVQQMCGRVQLSPVTLVGEEFDQFLMQVRKSHSNGGAYVAAFDVGPDRIFDWFASRDRLADENLLDFLIVHPSIRRIFPELFTHVPKRVRTGLTFFDQFLFDGTISRVLYTGGAYSEAHGDGGAEKAFALKLCDAMFQLRFGEVSCYMSNKAWSRWFKGVAWDVTAMLFDRRARRLWLLAVTDTDLRV